MNAKNYPETRIKSESSGKKYPDSSSSREDAGCADFAALPHEISDSDRWKLGGCPRCKGDVFLDSEDGELLGHCLQCGFVGARVVKPAARLNPDD